MNIDRIVIVMFSVVCTAIGFVLYVVGSAQRDTKRKELIQHISMPFCILSFIGVLAFCILGFFQIGAVK